MSCRDDDEPDDSRGRGNKERMCLERIKNEKNVTVTYSREGKLLNNGKNENVEGMGSTLYQGGMCSCLDSQVTKGPVQV